MQHIRRRERTLRCLYGGGWVIAAIFGGAICIGLLDWFVHLNDPGVRIVLGLAVSGCGLLIGWRFLVAPLLRPLSDVDVALWIEQHHREFNDGLASTIQFLQEKTDPRLGSPALQDRVIRDTVARASSIDVTDIVDARPARRAVAAACLVCVTALLLSGLSPENAVTALERILFPLSAGDWPKRTELRLVDSSFEPIEHNVRTPLRAAQGETFEIFVQNAKGPLPQMLFSEQRIGQRSVTSERLRPATLLDEAGRPHEVGVMRLFLAEGPVWFRAVGGDDDRMPFFQLQVVPPPVFDDARMTLIPPSYSGHAHQHLADGVTHAETLVGTRVEFIGQVKKPLRSAVLRLDKAEQQPIALESKNGQVLTRFEIVEAGLQTYWIELKDRGGFQNREAARFDIRGIADQQPSVYLDRPSTDMNITVNAEIPLRIVAKDDLGLKEIRLQHQLGESADTAGVRLTLQVATDRPRQLVVEHRWRIAELPLQTGRSPDDRDVARFRPGTRIVLRAEATDWFDLGDEHVGFSLPRTLTIVSAEEKRIELATRQGLLLEELERVYQVQTRAHGRLEELQTQLTRVGRLQPGDVDLLKRVEFNQRDVAFRLVGTDDGAEARTRELIAEMVDNHIDDAEMTAQLNRMAHQLALLRDEALATIEQRLTRARKQAEADAADRNKNSLPDSSTSSSGSETSPSRAQAAAQALGSVPVEEPLPADKPPKRGTSTDTGSQSRSDDLAVAHEAQAAVLETLDDLVRQLSRWRNRRDLTDDLDNLVLDQESLNQITADLGKTTLGKLPADLTPQQRADLARLSRRQRRSAETLGRFRGKLNTIAEELADTQPAEAEILFDAEAHIQQQVIQSGMQEAAGNLEDNSVGQAMGRQKEALADLRELQAIIQFRGVTDTESLVRKLKDAEQALEALRSRQQELLQRNPTADEVTQSDERRLELERLTKQQDKLRQEASALSRRLRRLQARRAAESTRRAASRMQRSAQELAATREEQAHLEQREAEEDLSQALRELARTRRAAEERLARESLERIAGELEAMIAREQAIIDETVQLDEERARRGNWSRRQLRSLRDLADVQQGLRSETEQFAESVRAAEVFALALRGAARQMQTAADRLRERRTDRQTIAAEKSAKKRLADLIAALKEDPADQTPAAEPRKGGSGTGDAPPANGIAPLAQLKMLRTLQQDILHRTRDFDASLNADEQLTPEQQSQLDAITLEQEEVADLARSLTRKIEQTDEPDEEAGTDVIEI
jgi:hypothetical protein